MATVNFCERVGCETMAKSPAMGAVSFRTAPNREAKNFELCPGCVGDLVEFLKVLPEGTERPKSYSEPWNPEQKKDKTLEEMSSAELAALYGKKVAEETQKILER